MFKNLSRTLVKPAFKTWTNTLLPYTTRSISIQPRITPKQHNKKKSNHSQHKSISLPIPAKISPCTTFTTCETYDLKKILNDKELNVKNLIPNEILHFKYKFSTDIFIFSTGSIVVWGEDEAFVQSHILPLLEPYSISKYAAPESEDMDYIETSDLKNHSSSFIENDIIYINSQDKDQALYDKAAFSSGLTRSTRLAILETALETHILGTRKITESLSTGKKLTVTEKEALRTTGRLFLLRGKLNLYSELIEIPDLYWSEPSLEAIYREISKNLDISSRISILNKKLDYATDEARALMQTLNEEKSARLEWIIIYLIMIEVCFEIYHFYERFIIDKK